jgi:hypothetical protein
MKALFVMGAGFALVAPAAAVAQDQVSGEARWNQVVACATQRSVEARHACMDDVLRAAGALDTATEVAVNRENFGREERAVPPPPPSAPPPAPVAAAAVAVPARVAPPPPVTGISTRVASVRLSGDRKLRVTTTEGAVWQQSDSDTIRRMPREGEAFEVREGSLGSYRCTFNETTTFRCERRD